MPGEMQLNAVLLCPYFRQILNCGSHWLLESQPEPDSFFPVESK